MSKVTLAEVGWTEYVRETLTEALDRAQKTVADMHMLALCDAAGCGFMFDTRDARCLVAKGDDGCTYHFCPACEIEAKTKTKKRKPSKPPVEFGRIDGQQ